MNLNLDEGIADSFDFQLGGKKYTMFYPTSEQQDRIAKTENTEATLELFYELITPVEPDTMPIKEAIAKHNIKIAQRFITMIREQLYESE